MFKTQLTQCIAHYLIVILATYNEMLIIINIKIIENVLENKFLTSII